MPTYLILLAFIIGISGSIVAHYYPIRNVLGKRLRDALDIFFRAISTVEVFVYQL